MATISEDRIIGNVNMKIDVTVEPSAARQRKVR